jgi:hypothetical protein
VKKGFFETNLSELVGACEALLQTNKNTLVIFTLKGLFRELSCFYDNAPVAVQKADVLTEGLEEKILELLGDIDSASWSSVESLISLYQSNKAKLEADS